MNVTFSVLVVFSYSAIVVVSILLNLVARQRLWNSLAGNARWIMVWPIPHRHSRIPRVYVLREASVKLVTPPA